MESNELKEAKKLEKHILNIDYVETEYNNVGIEVKIAYWLMLPLIVLFSAIIFLFKLPFNLYGDILKVSRFYIVAVNERVEGKDGNKSKN